MSKKYILYDKNSKQIIAISNDPIQNTNPSFAVTETTIDHNYIYIDENGVAKEYPQDVIKTFKEEDLKRQKEIAIQKYKELTKKILSQWKKLFSVIPCPETQDINKYSKEAEQYILNKKQIDIKNIEFIQVLYYNVITTIFILEYEFIITLQSENNQENIYKHFLEFKNRLEQLQLSPPINL